MDVGLPTRASSSAVVPLAEPWHVIAPTYVRKVLHISLGDFGTGIQALLDPTLDRGSLVSEIEDLWMAHRPHNPSPIRPLVALSVRTSMSLLFSTLALPPGTEVFLSAATIHDVVRVVEHYGLVPVPIDLDLDTLAPRLDLLEYALSSSTTASRTGDGEGQAPRSVFLAAYVFGSRYSLAPYVELCREYGVLMVEDAAQAFTGLRHYTGSRFADLSMFSFGSIKRATAFGGAVVSFNSGTSSPTDPTTLRVLRKELGEAEADLPIRSRSVFASKLFKYMMLRYPVSNPTALTLIAWVAQALDSSLDELITGMVRGFPGDAFFDQIKQRPSAPLLALLLHRLKDPSLDDAELEARCALAEYVRANIPPSVTVPGAEAPVHSYWLFPLIADEPDTLIAALSAIGIDATQGASQMSPVSLPPSSPSSPERRARVDPKATRRLLGNMVYIPISQHIPTTVVDDIITTIRTVCASHALPSKL